MNTIILDGNYVSNLIKKDLEKKLNKKNKKLKLVIFKINNDVSTDIYIRKKINVCNSLGINVDLIEYDDKIQEDIIINKIKECNNDNDITGIIVELPIFKNYNQKKILNSINPKKDVDGLTDSNLIKLIHNDECFIPCTVLGIEKLLEYYNIDINNKNVTIINRSNLIGKPLFFRLLNKDCTVTICHTKTKNIDKICNQSDIIISAVGKKDFINEKFINNNSIIIDAGITKENNKTYGDVNYSSVFNKCLYLTKTPGGIGPMNVISLVENLYNAYVKQDRKDDIHEENN